MEYIYPNLPNYTKITSRAATSNAVVSSGAVLLFSEDGNTLTAKHPDGTYTTVGGGGSGGVDPSSTTATPDKVLSGYLFLTSAGAYASGTIPTVTPESSGSTVNISSGYLAAPVSIVVSGGVDVSDTTATAADVLSGAVFHDSTGAVTTGGILVYPASTFTPTTSAQYIPAGVYLGGSQTIPGDPALVGSNLISGTSIFGVSGTIPVNSGATITPGPTSQTISAGQYLAGAIVIEPASGGSGGADYYRCVSVSSGGSTWTGNRAVLSGGSYSYESAVTSGLSFGAVTPEVGKTYTDGALVIATLYTGIPLTGLVFYAALNASAGTAETGQTLTAIGDTITYSTVSGIPCGQFNGNSALRSSDDSSLAVGSTASISLWLKMADTENTIVAFQIGDTYSNYECLNCAIRSRKVSIGNQGQETTATSSINTDWHHIAATLSNRSCNIYLDGSLVHTSELYIDVTQTFVSIGSTIDSEDNFYEPFSGYLAAVRVYNRVLTALEISALAGEFTPA